MIFSLEHAGERREVEVVREDDGYAIVDGDDAYRVDAQAVAPGWWSLLLGSRSFDAAVEREGTTYTVEIGGRRFVFDLSDPARAALGSTGRAGQGAGRVLAPMPGRVLRLLVQPGQTVAQGDGVAVVEAMKMENELTAPRDGVVDEVAVAEGDTVEGGTLMVVIGEAAAGADS